MAYNAIYEKLAGDQSDLIGALAYMIYKQQKVDFCKSLGDREASREELYSFHAVAALDTSLAAYRRQGATLAQAFLESSLDELVARTEAATRKDALSRQIDSVQNGLSARLAAISNGLDAKRSFAGWVRDISANLLVNLLSIFVLGALLLGYRFSGDLQLGAEKTAGLGSVSALQMETGPAKHPGSPAAPAASSSAPPLSTPAPPSLHLPTPAQ